MKQKILLLSLLAFVVASLQAKVKKDKFEKSLEIAAEDFFTGGHYAAAEEVYTRLDSLRPNFLKYRYYLAVCESKTNHEPEKALKILKDIQQSGNLKEDKYSIEEAELEYYLAKTYHLNMMFDKAVQTYEKALMDKELSFEMQDDCKLSIKMCQVAKELTTRPIDVKIENLGKPVNSIYDEHSAIVTADQEYLFFTSKRPGNVGGRRNLNGYEDPYGMFFEDIYMAKNFNGTWRKPLNLSDTINTSQQEASTGLSADGQTLYLYVSGLGIEGDVYESKKDGLKWGVPTKLPRPINTHNYLEGHVTISGTENEIYFTSDRENGIGGRDIYVCRKKTDGTWGKAENLGEMVNTPHNELGPYIHADGKTLFFASKGHESMGGYDIFKTVWDGEVWSKPENIGYPLNTTGDDVFFVLAADGRKGYFTSRRPGGLGGSDIYSVEVDYSFGDEPVVVVMKGVVNELGQAVDAKIIVYDIDRNIVVGEYESNSASGDYLLALPPDANYNIEFVSKDGKFSKDVNLFLKDVDDYVEIKHDVDVKEDVGKKKKMKNIQVDENGNVSVGESKNELKKIQDLLEQHPDMNIEVVVLTDTTKKNKLNLASALGASLAKAKIDTSRVKATAKMTEGSTKKQEVEVQVLTGSVSDQIVVENDQVVVKKNSFEEAVKEGSNVLKEMKQTKEENIRKPMQPKEIPQSITKDMVKMVEGEGKDVYYSVQIGAFKNELKSSHPFFHKEADIRVKTYKDGLTRYTIGTFKSFPTAERFRQSKLNLFPDAFITMHEGGERTIIEQDE